MLVRRERPEDAPAVAGVVTRAFARPGGPPVPVETTLLAWLRADEGWLPALSLVAERDGVVCGHVVCTRASAGGAPALGLGPVAVEPERQGSGVGSALLHAVLAAAEAQDEPLVALLGDPAFYRRFGFVRAADLDVYAPDPLWGGNFQARRLAPSAPTGAFRYAAPFDRL